MKQYRLTGERRYRVQTWAVSAFRMRRMVADRRLRREMRLRGKVPRHRVRPDWRQLSYQLHKRRQLAAKRGHEVRRRGKPSGNKTAGAR